MIIYQEGKYYLILHTPPHHIGVDKMSIFCGPQIVDICPHFLGGISGVR